MKKKMVSIILCLVLAGALLAGCGSSSDDSNDVEEVVAESTEVEEVVETEATGAWPDDLDDVYLVSADFSTDDNAISINTRYFIDAMEELSDGHIHVEENFGGVLANSQALYDTISTGVADFGTISPLFNPSDLPLSQISTAVPFGATDSYISSEAMNALKDTSDAFAQEYEQDNLVCLYFKGTENYSLMTKNDIQTLDDLKGLSTAVGGVYYPSWFEALGCVCTAADSSAAYQDLKTNVYSAFWAFDSSYVQYDLYEVCDYILEMDGGARCTQELVFNLDTFNSLDSYVQDIIMEASQISYDEYNEWLSSQQAGWRQELEDQGVIFNVLSDEDKAAWADIIFETDDNSIQAWIDTVSALGYDGAAIMSDYLTALTDAGVEFQYDITPFIQ